MLCVFAHNLIHRLGLTTTYQTLTLRLKSLPPVNLSVAPTNPLPLPALSHIRSLLNQSLDCIDITRWTGDRHSASFISSQLRLLHSIIREALAMLKPSVQEPPDPSHGTEILTSPTSASSSSTATTGAGLEWSHSPTSPQHFRPPLPANVSLSLTPSSTSLLLTIRVLEPAVEMSKLGSRLVYAIGAQRRLEHDEMEGVYMWMGEEVRVKEKVCVESSADPALLSLGAKLGALERSVLAARGCLGGVMGEPVED